MREILPIKLISVHALVLIIISIDIVQCQPSQEKMREPCGLGEGVVVGREGVKKTQSLERLCQPCPPETFSEINRLSNLRLCTQCAVCAPHRQVIRPCSLTRDTVCGDCMAGYRYDFLNELCEQIDIPMLELQDNKREGDDWQKKTISEHQAIVIVTGTAGVLCAMMISTMVIVWLKHRCEARKNVPKCQKQLKAIPIYKGLPAIGNKGPYNSLLLPRDEGKLILAQGRLTTDILPTDLTAQLLGSDNAC